RLIPQRNMGRDVAIHQCLEQPGRAINTVACEPLGAEIEAALDAIDHGLSDGDLRCTVGARSLSVDDDPGLVVDEIVRIVSKERVAPLPPPPRRWWVGRGAFFRRLASTAPPARPAGVAAATLLITAGGIEDREVLANRTRCLLGLRPGNRLIARRPLLLVHICFDQARIDRKPFAANQPNRDALRHYA